MTIETAPSPNARPERKDDRLRLPDGTTLTALRGFVDARGTVAELYRENWPTGISPVQWSMTVTHAGVMRGVHVHRVHDDYLCVVQGRVCVGLCDLRPGSPTERHSVCIDLTGDELGALFIPHGVAHGFYAHEPSTYVLGTSHYYDPADELGCHWTDPGLALAWPFTSPSVSARDAALPGLEALLPAIGPWRAA